MAVLPALLRPLQPPYTLPRIRAQVKAALRQADRPVPKSKLEVCVPPYSFGEPQKGALHGFADFAELRVVQISKHKVHVLVRHCPVSMGQAFALLISGCEASDVSYVLPSLPPSLYECVALADTVWQLSAISRRVPAVHDSWLTALQHGIDQALAYYREDMQARSDECAAHGGTMPSDIAGALAFHSQAMKRVHAVITSDDVMGPERTSGTILDALYDASRTPMQPHSTYFNLLFFSVWRCWLSHLSAWVAHGSLLSGSDRDFLVRDTWSGTHHSDQPPHAEWNSRFSVFWPAVPRHLLSAKQASAVLEMGLASRVLGVEGGDPLLATLAKRAAASSVGGTEHGASSPLDADVHLSSATRSRIAAVFRALGTQSTWDALAFSVALDKVAAVLQRYLWATLLFRSALPSHLTALQNYALLGRGELFGQFLELSAPLLKSASDAFARVAAAGGGHSSRQLLDAHSGMAVLKALEGHLQAGPWAAAGVATACDSDPHFARVAWALVPPCLDCVLDLRCAGFSADSIRSQSGEGGEGGLQQTSTTGASSKALSAALARHSRVRQWVNLLGPRAEAGPTGVVLGAPKAQMSLPADASVPQGEHTPVGNCVWLASPASCEGGFIATAVAQLLGSSGTPQTTNQEHAAVLDSGAESESGASSCEWLHLALHSDARQWELPPPAAALRTQATPLEPPSPPCTSYITCSIGLPRTALASGTANSAVPVAVQVRVHCAAGSAGDSSRRELVADTVHVPAAATQGGSIHAQIQYVAAALGRPSCLRVSLFATVGGNAEPHELCCVPCTLQDVLRPVGLRSLATFGIIQQDNCSCVNVQRLRWEQGTAAHAGAAGAAAAVNWLHMVRQTLRRQLMCCTHVYMFAVVCPSMATASRCPPHRACELLCTVRLYAECVTRRIAAASCVGAGEADTSAGRALRSDVCSASRRACRKLACVAVFARAAYNAVPPAG